MRKVSASSMAAMLLVTACSGPGWLIQSETPPFDEQNYGAVVRERDPVFKSEVERLMAMSRVRPGDVELANIECRDFAYRPHLTIPDQFLVRCDRQFLVIRDGLVLGELIPFH
jgi:hypothetical protein